MKRLKGVAVLLLAMSLTMLSCKKDDNSSSSSSSVTTGPLNSALQQGSWRVTFFESNGVDETSHYAGYSFVFASSGSSTATNSLNTVNGLWSSGTDDSQLKLILNYSSNIPFEELNSDWHVLQQTSTLIRLEDVSGGNGGTDLLTFTKN
ncbi:MAG: hypothetical protein IPP51_06685 [Bacteroidetes bacterium]|nr:hypothetical protein [Bacteroidota bacterium]